jgi:predicted dienelactone hydrolase
VPDLRFLLDRILEEGGSPAIDSNRIGLVGHSFGGWSVLATPERESRIGAIVALAPAGATDPRPGILPVELTFAWSREVPVLYIVAENDTPLPLQGMHELFDRTRGRRLMIILGGADHSHFEDDVERRHEEVRGMSFPEYLSWLPAEMLPISSLITGDQAHLAIRGLALAHFDATLKREERADELLSGDIVTSLASHGLKVAVRRD